MLQSNDTGETTIPANGIYPHQWNWDSALISLGWVSVDPDRAWRELRSLVGMQMADGMIPHIAFDRRPNSYLPGPDWWGDLVGMDGRRVSGITQPPVLATCLRLLWQLAPDELQARQLLAPISHWHSWLLRVRDPQSIGEPVIVHPWESGRDNAIDWDVALERLPNARTSFDRADTDFVDETQRPTKVHYDKYMYLVEWFRDHGWNQDAIGKHSPFRMLDPGFSAILTASASDLAAVATELGESAIAEESMRISENVGESLKQRASTDGLIRAVDLTTGDTISTISCGSALSCLNGHLTDTHIDAIVESVTVGVLSAPSGVLSAASNAADFSPENYWRGPVWANISWLVALGLDRRGRNDAAELLRYRQLSTYAKIGAREYNSPSGTTGLGANGFSWSSALALVEVERLAQMQAH